MISNSPSPVKYILAIKSIKFFYKYSSNYPRKSFANQAFEADYFIKNASKFGDIDFFYHPYKK